MTAPIIHRDQALGFRCGDTPREYVMVNDALYTDGNDRVDFDATGDSKSDLITRRYLRYIAANNASYYSLYHLSYTLGLTFQTVTYLAREMTLDKINKLPAV